METKNKTNQSLLSRAAAVLLLLLVTTLPASATDFITDVMVIGNSDKTEIGKLLSDCEAKGWISTGKDLNAGCGSGSDYIYLLYKTQNSKDNGGTPITGFYIKTGNNPPANLTHDGRTYHLVPYSGSSTFEGSKGDLNRGARGDYIHLYYTKEMMSDNTAVTDITFNDIQSGGIGADGSTIGYDLNEGAGGDYIYMHVTTALNPMMVTLTSKSGNVQLQDGYVLTGTGGQDTHVSIIDGATVTLSGLNITAIPIDENHEWAGISCLGDATIILDEGTTNNVKGGHYKPGIHVPEGKTLTIQGSGKLNATGGYYGAGIGGSLMTSCGNITISSGIVKASGEGCAGIGCGFSYTSCGDITISGGTVTAYGAVQAAGIGSSYYASCGDIIISGGTVTAYGGENAAGIGSGSDSSCGNITITNGVTMVTARYGVGCWTAIGRGYSSTCGTVTIGDELISKTEGDTRTLYPMLVTLTPESKDVLLRDGNVLTGTGGKDTHVTIADGATVTLSGMNITAIPIDASHKWAGISCLGDADIILKEGTTNNVKGGFASSGIYVPVNKTLTIQGSGTLNATYGDGATAGIGSAGYQSSCGNITISGGTVNAYGGSGAAGIGSGYDASCGDIIISGGTVTAYGGTNAAGIGSGYYASCGNITITNGVTMVTARYGVGGWTAIGRGYNSTCGTVTIGEELTSKTEGNIRTLYHDTSTAIHPSAIGDTGDSDDGWFTISGQRISSIPNAKGLYINNGKKTYLK